MANFNQSESTAIDLFATIAAQLAPYNGTSLLISTSYIPFLSYAAYYSTLSGGQVAVGTNAAPGSRFWDRPALTNSSAALSKMLNTLAGLEYEFPSNNFCLVSGGQVFRDGADPNSGVNPAWRRSYVHHIVGRCWASGSDAETQKSVHDDVTHGKVGSMRALAPNTGGYMNEGDRLDPLFLQDFYGGSLSKLQLAKGKFDPRSVFYCPTCVGSERWHEDVTGRLCPN